MTHEEDLTAKYEAEAKERWGATDAFQESQRRLASYSTVDKENAQAAQEEALQGILDVMDRGFPPTSLEAIVAADHCRQVISQWYFECTPEMHKQLATLYVTDDRFRAFYESRREGLAQYFHDAIHARAT
jgi:MerR family transcriptional regulator, thiopeptide resistance regulator